MARRPDPNAAITRLFRNPPQLRAIARQLAERRRLRLLVHAMADGAETVSLLIALDPARRPLDLRIEGRDLCAAYVADAKRFSYSRQHAPRNVDLGDFGAYLRRTLLGGWSVRKRWRELFHYAEGDVLQRPPDLAQEAYELVACQNLLINLPEEAVPAAFANLVSELAPGGILAAGGGPLGTIHRLAWEHGLEPVLDDLEAIHEAWEVQRAFWDKPKRPYWALEPFDAGHPERYCTLFRKAGRP
ncbi:MAG TPA: CheR family methyltransferase [Thermoanaerobaculia bacterium]|nr:CheR family methyltransferase [Thermoanaerobaculia bacterium]